MALQQSPLPVPPAAWFKKPAAIIAGVCFAGLMAVATFVYNPLAGAVAGKNISSGKQSSSGGGSCTEQKKQSIGSSTFSLMPGRLNRFLQ